MDSLEEGGDWLDAGDAANALLALLEPGRLEHRIYNVAYGQIVPVGLLLSVAAEALPGDAIVAVTATAICGADLLPVAGQVPGFEWGTVLGHEFVGTLADAGPEVPFRPGIRVVCSSTYSCGHCRACRAGACLSGTCCVMP